MKFDPKYGESPNFKVKTDKKEQKSIFQLARPKSCYEVNHEQKTPFTERRCMNCRGLAGNHFYLPICDMSRLGKLWCRKDATNYFRELVK